MTHPTHIENPETGKSWPVAMIERDDYNNIRFPDDNVYTALLTDRVMPDGRVLQGYYEVDA
jgi:hypothetical protein